jgi:rhodanese-related sulfurtransferase
MALPVAMRRLHGPVDFIQPHEVAADLQAGVGPPVLDLRPSRDFARERIPGSENVAPEDVAARIGGGDGAVLVCQSDTRAIRTAARLGKAGVGGVRVLQGGLFRWKRSRLPTVKDLANR